MPVTEATCALLAALLASAGDSGASGDPVVRGHARTFAMLGGRPFLEGSGPPRLGARLEAPIIQDFFLDVHPGVEGVSIVLDAWTAIDAGDRTLADRAIADITEGWIEWRVKSLSVRAGRILLFSEVGRGDRVDGALASYHARTAFAGARLVLEGFGGVPVFASFGEDPLLENEPLSVLDPLLVAPGGLDTERAGDWMVGARAGLSRNRAFDLGVGYARRAHAAEIDREALLGRIALWPLPELRLASFVSFDVFGRGFEEIDVSAGFAVHERVRVGVYGRSRRPDLLLPSTSILSVFGSAPHRELGFDGDVFLDDAVRASGSTELRRTGPADDADEGSNGYRIALELRGPLPGLTGARTAVAVERLRDGRLGGYDYARVAAEVPAHRALMLSADAGGFVIDDPSRSPSTGRIALRGGLSGTFDIADAWRVVLSFRATKTPGISTEGALFGRLEWNVATVF